MNVNFQINDPSIESQWRAIILFGNNSATYKFAFAKALLQLIDKEKTSISIKELAIPFAKAVIDHIKISDKQGSAKSSKFLAACREHVAGNIEKDELYKLTEKFGFVNVVDAFQNVNGSIIPSKFYDKNYARGKKEIVITDDLLKIKELYQYRNLDQEVEARWSLVETAWNLQISRNSLEVQYDVDRSLFFIEHNLKRRKDITSVRDALNGYQKGKCFYSFKEISINKKDANVCSVDHFLPHVNIIAHNNERANLNGVWNLVLADSTVNIDKSSKIPEKRFLERLYTRNEYYIQSKHPLAETIINQTGKSAKQRQNFLERQYNLALSLAIQTWKSRIEELGTF